jgi:hypothetical protein
MAVDIKVAPEEKLELVQTLITDTSINSEYFNISELSDSFSGGKNAFLIAGSDLLEANSEIKIQIRDAAGNIVYHEFSDGSPNEYYEGNSKVVAVYVYPTETAFGPATITILGELNTKNVNVPIDWQNKYNVKWQGRVNINPALSNTTRVRFKKRPVVTITELLQPLYSIVSGSKVASLVTQSFASITVNQLDTFAGDVARVKVYRTSEGDISDYDLIQDISIEAKNLLTTYELSGSVVGNAGTFGPDTLSKVWNTSSLYAVLDTTNVENGLQLSGSGKFSFTSSLNLLSSNTYELQLDVFYTGSSATNLVAYISGTQNGEIPITTFSGSIPTKNFETTITAFKIPKDEPTASLYLSQSSGTNQWHVGNISLNLSQDTAFSPNEISFITSMPTILGNDIFNFKFEFYDINNNYVPVAVTQSATFNGGNSLTQALISGSASSSNAALTALSQSVSSSISSTSQSVSSSIAATSASLSSSISQSTFTASLFTSASVSTLSGSVSTSINLVSGSLSSSINVVSGSVVNLSSSVSTSLSTLSSSLSASLSNISSSVSNSSFTVYSASAYLEKFIFTDENGKLNKTPTTSSTINGLYLGSTYLGFYSGSSWKTYMDNQGDFYLTGSNNNFLAWNSSLGTLQVQGVINIQGGNAATTSSVATAAANAVTSGSNAANNVSNSLAPNIFTSTTGLINRPPVVLVGSTSGLYLGSSYLGYYNGTDWKTYMANNGNFYLSGPGTNALTWANGVLTINGIINVTGGDAATSASAFTMATNSANTAQSNASASAFTMAGGAYTNASASAFTIAGGAYTNASSSAFIMAAGAYSNASHSAYLSANTAYTNAKTIADNIANGSYSGGTLISGQSIVSPIIAGADGYFSNTVKVGGTSALTISGLNKAIYSGAGNWYNADTGFYINDGGYFSLSNKLNFNAANNTLTVNGNITTISGNIGGWEIGNGYLRSSNSQTYLYSTGFIELKDSAGQNKVTIDSSATLPSPSAGSDSGNIVVPAQAAQTSYYNNGAASGGNTAVTYNAGTNTYSLQWSQQVVFTPTITGFYEFTTWFPKHVGLGSSGTGGGYQGLRAYIYDMAGNSLINDEGREYIEGPVEGADVNATPPAGRPYFAPGTYGNQYDRDGTGAYFSNQLLTAGVAVRFTIQYIVYNIPYGANLTINAYWPATNVQYISNVPKTNINQQGFQVVQDTNRYLQIRPSGWYMYNDPALYGASPPQYLGDQGNTEVTGIMGGTLVVLNATDKNDWHSGKQKQYIRSAQYSFANRAAGGNFITSFFFGGYARSFNLTRAYGWFQPNTNTGFSVYEDSWWPYAYNIESITRISYGKFQVTFAEAIMDSYGAYSGGGTYSVFIGNRTNDGPTQFQQAGISNIFHTGFTMDLGVETPDNRFVSIMIIQ